MTLVISDVKFNKIFLQLLHTDFLTVTLPYLQLVKDLLNNK